ncbi:MAG: hypothetical protein ACRC24_04635 [Vibrionaceae bacterium]
MLRYDEILRLGMPVKIEGWLTFLPVLVKKLRTPAIADRTKRAHFATIKISAVSSNAKSISTEDHESPLNATVRNSQELLTK